MPTEAEAPMGTVGPSAPIELTGFPNPTGQPEHHPTSTSNMSDTDLFSATCPKDYTEFRGICYRKSEKPGNSFSNAAAACRKDGGTLAMPKDAATDTFLISLHKPEDIYSIEYFWIGLHDQHREGSFEWVDGTPLGEYTSWGQGQPDDHGDGEDCVLFSESNGRTRWSDFPCYYYFLFICQVIPDRTDDDGANEGRSLKNFIRAHRSCMVAVVVILTIMGLTTVILMIKMEISELSVAVAALSNMDIKVKPIVSFEKVGKTLVSVQ
uniref:C-type lectin domain-containing protein n=1 Tax=Branchiostoma floridae TaxID=7739 RepID=C4A120_BRAFL|eukprot:XP_002585503.1 hypothetical protein BRAFLDRAFT_111946 [Branchiostoma floridae]